MPFAGRTKSYLQEAYELVVALEAADKSAQDLQGKSSTVNL